MADAGDNAFASALRESESPLDRHDAIGMGQGAPKSVRRIVAL